MHAPKSVPWVNEKVPLCIWLEAAVAVFVVPVYQPVEVSPLLSPVLVVALSVSLPHATLSPLTPYAKEVVIHIPALISLPSLRLAICINNLFGAEFTDSEVKP